MEVALEWQSMGAPRVHIVDLDGAASGELINLDIITEIAQTLLVPVQIGGGIRDLDIIEQLLKSGVDRVILGTAAVKDPDLVKNACQSFSDSIIVGVDALNGKLAIQGWKEHTEIKAIDFARQMMEYGVKRFVFTDISRDGTLTEPNFSAIAETVKSIKAPVVAAGGIATITHLELLDKIGVEGAIIGKALYTGNINLKQALAAVGRIRR